ncbi:MAG: zf-TFIIB domain-containing protein [Rubrivivax sp.]|nr:zf-TFIIB domain-containing protein [Rubrivivax sp.]
MKCPHCPDVHLVMSDRQGIEIDYCPQCRGVWLDRGELDKLIERAVAVPRTPERGDVQRARPDFVDSDHHRSHDHRKSRRKSWLSDIFD